MPLIASAKRLSSKTSLKLIAGWLLLANTLAGVGAAVALGLSVWLWAVVGASIAILQIVGIVFVLLLNRKTGATDSGGERGG